MWTAAPRTWQALAQKTHIRGRRECREHLARRSQSGAAVVAMGLAFGAAAQQTVKIGVIYPLSGNSASAGNYSKMAIEVGADVVNNGNAELAKLCRWPRAAACPA